jgi:hypothetical protein
LNLIEVNSWLRLIASKRRLLSVMYRKFYNHILLLFFSFTFVKSLYLHIHCFPLLWTCLEYYDSTEIKISANARIRTPDLQIWRPTSTILS